MYKCFYVVIQRKRKNYTSIYKRPLKKASLTGCKFGINQQKTLPLFFAQNKDSEVNK